MTDVIDITRLVSRLTKLGKDIRAEGFDDVSALLSEPTLLLAHYALDAYLKEKTDSAKRDE
jgi:hypothetical protein